MQALTGYFLVATPDMDDDRFSEAVIYVVAHSEDGAMGLVVNRPLADMRLADILAEVELGPETEAIRVSKSLLDQTVLNGGPMDSSRGFVLHSADYFRADNSYMVDEDICLTATLDILRAMAVGNGPERSLLALGYCGWSAGQLEDELRHNGWLTVARSDDLLFKLPPDKKYDAALAALGVTRATLSPNAGNA